MATKAPAVAKLVCERCRQTIVRVYHDVRAPLHDRYWRHVLTDLLTHLRYCRSQT